MIEYKSIDALVKDVDVKGGIVTGYFSSTGNVDSTGDVMMKGCYTRTLSQRGPLGSNQIFHLYNHNDYAYFPLTKPRLLEERSDGNFTGLYFESKISQTQQGKDVILLYEDGVFNEHSVGFETLNSYEKEGIRYITEVKLYEGSTVLWGANEATPFTGFKSMLTVDQLDDRIKVITKAIRNGKYTDETFGLLEFQLKSLTQQGVEIGKKSLSPASSGTADPTHNAAELVTDLRKQLTFLN